MQCKLLTTSKCLDALDEVFKIFFKKNSSFCLSTIIFIANKKLLILSYLLLIFYPFNLVSYFIFFTIFFLIYIFYHSSCGRYKSADWKKKIKKFNSIYFWFFVFGGLTNSKIEIKI